MTRLGVTIIFSMLLSGCAGYNYLDTQYNHSALTGGAPAMDAKKAADPVAKAAQDVWDYALSSTTVNSWPQPGDTNSAIDKKRVVEAGLSQVESMCRGYFGTLEQLDKQRTALKKEVTLTGTTAVAVISAAAQHAARTLAYIGLGYGALNSWIDIETDVYLFEQAPQETAQMTLTAMAKARKDALKNIDKDTSDEHAKYVIGQYATNCTPQQIEVNVKSVIAKGAEKAQPTGTGAFLIQ